ncbi:MAG: amino acid permease [Dehalococcoidia bacterium]|nr:MAG: amino acid permease [Dehalococcoidia bacterium]
MVGGDRVAGAAPPGLQRRIGLFGATASGVGIILGAGIYVLVGEAAGLAGNGVWLAFLVSALLVAGTSLSYAELTSMLPEAGAASTYAQIAFGRRAGFVTGWMDVSENAIAAPAVALGFSSYLATLTGWDGTVIAIGLLACCAVIVLAGVSQTIGFATVFALIEASGLIVVIVVGLPHLGDVNLFEVHGGAQGLLGASALVFFAYIGFEEMASLSEEVKDPTRNIPRAMLAAAAISTLLYMLVAAVAVSVVPWERLAEADGPLALVTRMAISDRAADTLSLMALFATFNTVLLILATGPRVMYGMARRGMLPPALGTVWAARGTPSVAILITTAVAMAFALTGDIGFVAQVSNFAVFTLFVMVNGAVIWLRQRRPELVRPFRIRPSVGPAPLPAVIGLAGALGLAAFMDRTALVVGLGALAVGGVLSFILVPKRDGTT